MLNLSDLQIDNWFRYMPNGAYCVIRSVRPKLSIEHFENRIHECTTHDISSIILNEDIRSLAGFRGGSLEYTKKTQARATVFLVKDTGFWLLYLQENNAIPISYVHELQNEYYNLTKEKISINLFGI